MSLLNNRLEDRRYVLAISGGVDSVVLLDLLKDYKPIVAHFDHGIREDSTQDAQFVKSLAEKYGLPFELGSVKLGPETSEATARQARYDFLFSVCKKHHAELVTAHHQDDLLETSIINLIRGTGPHGLANMLRTDKVIRPLLQTPKAQLLQYAREHKLEWREDSTNRSQKYLRNYIRQRIVPELSTERQRLLGLIHQTAGWTEEIDELITKLASWLFEDGQLIRARFVQLDFKIAGFVMREWLFRDGIDNIDTQLIERMVIAAKTLQPGKRIDLDGQHILISQKRVLQIDHPRHV